MMLFEKEKYYHLYNRSNNNELLFRDDDNYTFFLQKYHTHVSPFVTTIAYCLMPTHFHFLIRCDTDDSLSVSKNIAIVLRSFTRAINKRYKRHGNLFQQNTKYKEITDVSYLVTLVHYIHQNPIRARISLNLDDWKFSSYVDIISPSREWYCGKDFILQYFQSVDDFILSSNKIVDTVKREFWI